MADETTITPSVAGAAAGDAGQGGAGDKGDGGSKVPVDGGAKAKADAAEAKRKLKLKVFGKEEEWDEENVVRFAQKGRAYEQQMQEVARQRKSAEQFENEFKKNKRGALEKAIGRDDLRAIAIDLLKEEIQDQADPKSAETRKLQRELEALREKERDRDEKEQNDKDEREADEWRSKWDKEFTDALGATKLRRSPVVMRRMAELQMLNLKKKLGVSVDKVAKLVEAEFLGGVKEYVKDLDADGFVQTFGEEWEEKVSKRRLDKLKTAIPKQETNHERREPQKRDKPMTRDEWLAEVERRSKG